MELSSKTDPRVSGAVRHQIVPCQVVQPSAQTRNLQLPPTWITCEGLNENVLLFTVVEVEDMSYCGNVEREKQDNTLRGCWLLCSSILFLAEINSFLP
jgi:hypothetical protein